MNTPTKLRNSRLKMTKPGKANTRVHVSLCIDWTITVTRAAHLALMELEREVFSLKNIEIHRVITLRVNDTLRRTFADVSFDAN